MRSIAYRTWIARGIARALLADTQEPSGTTAAALRARAAWALGENPAWLAALARRLAQMPAPVWQALDIAALAHRIQDCKAFERAFEGGEPPRIRHLALSTATMRPRPLGLQACAVPPLPTVADLAQWLDVPLDRLLWLCAEPPVCTRHYRYRLLAKRRGGLRLIEIPKADLKQVQRRINTGLLQHVPVHEQAHGFVVQRSVATHAAVHSGQAVVMRFDLQDFFGSIRAARVRAVFKTLGYPEGVAHTLAMLCTHRTAPMVVERLQDDGGLSWLGAKRLTSAHLPQGAPTSPALANLCAFNLDLRLDGLAFSFGATYTRYADDLVFSGPAALCEQFRALAAWVAAIAQDEGFALNEAKTRCLPQHHQQRITGVVVNTKPQTPRDDFDRLRACLHQCALHGPASQNTTSLADFRGHLLGRIAWVGQFNAARAGKLKRLFEQIQWADGAPTLTAALPP